MRSNEEILKLAKQAANNAYCPYSKFPVGAYAIFESGKEYSGCNIENSSYGLSLCAERNALSTAIANGEKTKLVKLAIFSPKTHLCFPCGACRQWIQELSCGFNTEIILQDKNGSAKSFFLNEILPYPFVMV